MYYLDDHLFFLPPSSVSSTSLLSQVRGIFDFLGVPVADNKVDQGHVFLRHLEPGRLTTMFTLMPRHKRTFCGGSTSDRPGVALWSNSSGSPQFLQFMFTLTPQGRSVPAVCGHHTFAFSYNGPLPGPQLTSSSGSWSRWLSWRHWGGHWHHSHVCFHIDNKAVVAILQRRSGRSVMVQHLCCFYFYSAFYQFITLQSTCQVY